ncbi:hypothetical protein [Bacillus atrophaeus]|uniref:Uncharacterized protein n=1 Tax=Bacillus atrophaeus (strain 1942) TaxID=720555 RepID=A0ABN3ZAG9_BACA1|nr:hypothetical protein [Bacillus atrophaeus]AMR62291.1 hypothetical protein A1D11_07670 [Bacillus subtilis subsp. globigii]ADP32923.1 hypothetical protein BATR1942_09950 [Bacillus atrophaeus 1942]AIK48332.1 hypothetical protein DJ95_1876 [Bacillus atrophaeus subsp. globigii]EIM12290.1 hypothetical protein UY9_03401 [Bacillus atrophaeus C89]KAA6454958.1 hypothetical protein DX926_02630 [Bacillus atrophaeus]
MFRTDRETKTEYAWEKDVPFILREQFVDLGYSLKEVTLSQVIALANQDLYRLELHNSGEPDPVITDVIEDDLEGFLKNVEKIKFFLMKWANARAC